MNRFQWWKKVQQHCEMHSNDISQGKCGILHLECCNWKAKQNKMQRTREKNREIPGISAFNFLKFPRTIPKNPWESQLSSSKNGLTETVDRKKLCLAKSEPTKWNEWFFSLSISIMPAAIAAVVFCHCQTSFYWVS